MKSFNYILDLVNSTVFFNVVLLNCIMVIFVSIECTKARKGKEPAVISKYFEGNSLPSVLAKLVHIGGSQKGFLILRCGTYCTQMSHGRNGKKNSPKTSIAYQSISSQMYLITSDTSNKHHSYTENKRQCYHVLHMSASL